MPETELVHATRFTMDTSAIKFGPGATREVGADMARLGGRRVMVVTDPRLATGETIATALDALRREGIDAVLYDRVPVEPTDTSFMDATAFAADGGFDGYVAVGGGSVMDTAKAANLFATYPAPLLTYVNPPIGEGAAGTRPAQTTHRHPDDGRDRFGDHRGRHLRLRSTARQDRHCPPRPATDLGIVDPDNTRTMPPMVAACSALDVLSHAVESFTALPYSKRPAPDHPGQRPAYQGANPISDVWASKAMEVMARNIARAVDDPSDDEARGEML